jgi:hypothetical protein
LIAEAKPLLKQAEAKAASEAEKAGLKELARGLGETEKNLLRTAAIRALPPRLQEVAKQILSKGKSDVTVDSLEEARQVIKAVMPDAVELPAAVVGKPYPQPPPGVKKSFQIQPPEPGVNNDLPHIKYEDWTGGLTRDFGGRVPRWS